MGQKKKKRRYVVVKKRIPYTESYKRALQFLVAGKDIGERKRIEAELKTNEKLMSEAQRIAHLGSWEHDAASGEVKWSHEEWRIFGLDQREFGPSFEEFMAMVHPDDRHIVKELMKGRRNQGKTSSMTTASFALTGPCGSSAPMAGFYVTNLVKW